MNLDRFIPLSTNKELKMVAEDLELNTLHPLVRR